MPASSTPSPAAAPVAPATTAGSAPDHGRMLARVLPDALAAATVLALAWPGSWLAAWLPESASAAVAMAVMVEAATLMFLCTVVDVASRLRRPPPWWAGLLLCAGLVAVYPEVPRLLWQSLDAGWWVALPIALSIGERLAEIWTLPRATRLEKQRRRALTFGRLFTGLVLAGGFIACLGAETLLRQDGFGNTPLASALLPGFVAAFFAISAFDAVRVHRPAFAAAPRNLWPRFDRGESAALDPL